VPGENGCSTSVCNDVNIVINQPTNSCNYVNVNVTSELHVKSAELGKLTLPTFSDSTKQVALHFIWDLDQYFNLRETHLTNYAYLWYSEQSKNLSQNSGCPVHLTHLKVTISLRKPLRNYFGIQVVRPVLGVPSIYTGTTQILENPTWIIVLGMQA
jgi:hypothetical protein